MSRIDLAEDILKHSDEEVIEFLFRSMADIRRIHIDAAGAKCPEVLFTTTGDIDIVYSVLKALDARNKENDV